MPYRCSTEYDAKSASNFGEIYIFDNTMFVLTVGCGMIMQLSLAQDQTKTSLILGVYGIIFTPIFPLPEAEYLHLQ